MPTAILNSRATANKGSDIAQALNHRRGQSARVCAESSRQDRSSLGPIANAGRLVQTIGLVAMVQAAEVALMAAFVGTAPRQFVDSDPEEGVVRSVNADTAQRARPVLLVHGFGGIKSSWSVVARALGARGVIVDAITYRPFGTSVERVADHLVVEVQRVLSQTGADKVHLVGHSLGGVVIAEAIASGGLAGQVDTVVTLGAPFRGSPYGWETDALPRRLGRASVAAVMALTAGPRRSDAGPLSV